MDDSISIIRSVRVLLIRIIYLVFLGLLSIKAVAQETITSSNIAERISPKHHIFFVEYSHSPTSYIFLGKTPFSSSERTNVGYISPFTVRISGAYLYYSARLHPIIEYTYSKRDAGGSLDTIRGWSLDPLGLSSFVQLNKTTHLRNTVYGGFTIMPYTFPTDKGRRLNFNFELQSTIEQALGKQYVLSFGGAFHHISNAQTGEQNPGIDSIYLLLRLSYLIN
jgi:hypothetical protein